MKRSYSPLILAVLAITVAATSWAAAATCPATGKSAACTTPCPEGTQKKPATCPRNSEKSTPSICAVKKTTCTAKRPSCGSNAPRVMAKEKDGWKLVVHILQPGSRSQGYHGELYKDDKRVEGKKGETLETSFGNLTWKGTMEERVHLWDSTGWVSEDGNPFLGETMPSARPQTSLDELDKQIDQEMGKE
ncbi:hypothetical protein DSLASN_47170 [Desulfoluna limicola]|uniref:Lipoprotein n=1 Tax=Desulfoluna limicola TaxID=2810562 RepID=A0ABM7PNH5_9BACT|nr:hypothetical protein [Desulfoluna limicola]BCS99085.1 hypothetical protein DSLASN_47170 [Desulfoluna limicola]